MQATLNQRLSLCFFGGLFIAVAIIIAGIVIGYHYQNPWLTIGSEFISLLVSMIYINCIVKFVKIKEPDYHKHN